MKRIVIIILLFGIAGLTAAQTALAFDRCELEVYNKNDQDPCVVVNDVSAFEKNDRAYYRGDDSTHPSACNLPAIVGKIHSNGNICRLRHDDEDINLILFQPAGVPDHNISVNQIRSAGSTTTQVLPEETIELNSDRRITLAGFITIWDGHDDDDECLGDPNGDDACNADANTFHDGFWDEINDPYNWSNEHKVTILLPDKEHAGAEQYRAKLRILSPETPAEDGGRRPAFRVNAGKLSLYSMDVVITEQRSFVETHGGRFFMNDTRIRSQNGGSVYRGNRARIDNDAELYEPTGTASTLGESANQITGSFAAPPFDFIEDLNTASRLGDLTNPASIFDPAIYFDGYAAVRFPGIQLGELPLYRFADTPKDPITCTLFGSRCYLPEIESVFTIDEKGAVVPVPIETVEGSSSFPMEETIAGTIRPFFLRNGRRVLPTEGEEADAFNCRFLGGKSIALTLCDPALFEHLGTDHSAELFRKTNNEIAFRLALTGHGTLVVTAIGDEALTDGMELITESGVHIAFDAFDETLHCSAPLSECSLDGECPLTCDRVPAFAAWENDDTHALFEARIALLVPYLRQTAFSIVETSDDELALAVEEDASLSANTRFVSSAGEIMFHDCPPNTRYDSGADTCAPRDGYEWNVNDDAAYPTCVGETIPSGDGTSCLCPNPSDEIVRYAERTRCLAPCAEDEHRHAWACLPDDDNGDTGIVVESNEDIFDDDDEANGADEMNDDGSALVEGWSFDDNAFETPASGADTENAPHATGTAGCTLLATATDGAGGMAAILLLTILPLIIRRSRAAA